MTSPSLADLVTPSTAQEILAIELSVASGLGLPTTSWNPLDPSRTIFQINGNVAASYSSTVALMAQGGYLSYAALMVDSDGNPITTWMDLVGVNNYNVTRIPATAAAGNVPVQNVTATSYPYSPNQPLHFQNPSTGATYTTTGTGTIAASGSPPTPQVSQVAVQADVAWIGTAGTSGTGVVLTLLTPLAGVSCTALTTSLVGSNAELNGHYLTRCQSKLGSLSPNGASQAYVYVAESIPVFGQVLPSGATFSAPTSANPWGVVTEINRADTQLSIGSGIINVYVANASGAVIGGAQIAVSHVTWGTGTATVTTATPHGLGSSGNAYVIISGVNGATGVNNQIANMPAWYATVTGPSSFTFALATNPGAYTSGGSVEAGDLGMVDAAIQAQAVPDGQVSLVHSATVAGINVTATVYIKTSAGLASTAAVAAISAALSDYFASVPIGGVNAETNGIVPYSELIIVIANANVGTVSVILTTPSGDTALTSTQVPVLGSLAITVVYV